VQELNDRYRAWALPLPFDRIQGYRWRDELLPRWLGVTADDRWRPPIDTEEETFYFEPDEPGADAYAVSGSWRTTGQGVEICDLHIRPSRRVLEDGEEHDRSSEEIPVGGITIAVLSATLRLRDIKTAIRKSVRSDINRAHDMRKEADAADHELTVAWLDTQIPELEEAERSTRPPKRGGRKPVPDRIRAEWADDVLAAIRANRYDYVNILSNKWHVRRDGMTRPPSKRTIGDRIRKLKNDSWLVGNRHLLAPGPRLLEWREKGE